MMRFTRDCRGSAVKWFALAAATLSVASMAGAHGLDWLSRSGHVALVAYQAPTPAPNPRTIADEGVDPMPTGAIPTKALMIRIR